MLLKRTIIKQPLILGFTLLLSSTPLQALEVDREVMPRITVGGRVIATPTTESKQGFKDHSDENHDTLELSDSGLLLRFDKRLYQGGVAGAIVGFTKPDADSDLEDAIYYHQFHTFFYNRNFQLTLGQTNLRNHLIEFPTLRDDDLLDYTHVPNASSFAENDQYQVYGSIAAFDWFIDQKNTHLSVWVGSRVETEETGVEKEEFDYNTAGIGLIYEASEDLHYVNRIRHAGVIIDAQDVEGGKLDDDGRAEDAMMTAVIAGIDFNLNRDPSSNWSMLFQAISNGGVEDAELSDPNGLRRASSTAAVWSLRHTRRPNLLTRCMAALTIAHKRYDDESEATQTTVAPSYLNRIGQGIDFVAQISHTTYGDDLAALIGFESERSVQVGLVFSFDAAFNDQIGERDSILNLEHGYIE